MPDVEEEDEPPKIHSAPKNKKRKEIGGQNNDKVGLGHLISPCIWTLGKCMSTKINVCVGDLSSLCAVHTEQLQSVCLQEAEWGDGMKECSCSCHEGSGELKLKKSKRRSCSHCSSKVRWSCWCGGCRFCHEPH